MPISVRPRLAATAVVAWLAVVGALLVPQVRPASDAAAEECPPGYTRADAVPSGLAPDLLRRADPIYQGGLEVDPPDVARKAGCVNDQRPESFTELAMRAAEFNIARIAPLAAVPAGANTAAMAQRQELEQAADEIPGADGEFAEYGRGPLDSADPRYNRVNGLGITTVMGRIDDLKYDLATGQLFAALGTGGIWRSEDMGENWRSIGDNLPTQITGAVAWSPARGGTVMALSGEPTFGGTSYTGFGAFFTRDLGATWQRSEGIPDGALGFAMEVDPTNPEVVYAATSRGLFRSANAGETFQNTVLPVGDCAGVVDDLRACNFANQVTDVVVKAPDGVNAEPDPATVVAVVGWRGGTRKNPDGTVQSPANGIYRSVTGEPGTFELAPGLADAIGLTAVDGNGQARIGRTELGTAVGPEQDHDFLYALVSDAVKFNGGVPVLDAPEGVGGVPANNTALNGIYVSDDFGATWTQMADDNLIARNPASGTAFAGPTVTPTTAPGVQAWYNEWISPDPSRQDGSGVPTRLSFGLEEVWQNELTDEPQSGQSSFRVIGRYFSGRSCLFLGLGLPECPTNRGPTTSLTVHPDHHAGIWVESETGTALLVGHDGGFSKQVVADGEEMDNGKWQFPNNGFGTLLPYSSVIANDGTVWAGLQDNGHMRIDPITRERKQTFGGDGTFAAVDPENSNVAYESVQLGTMNVTTDGGQVWRGMSAPATGKRFVNPFILDPLNANHLSTGGREIFETLAGPATTTPDGIQARDTDWLEVFDLGTKESPGDPQAAASASSPNNSMTAIDTLGDATYVGFCASCDILNQPVDFGNGFATNVGGDAPPEARTGAGWHIAAAEGLPNRFITSVAMDPLDETRKTVYVTLGGYSRKYVPPGSVDDSNPDIGEGHVFKSTDAGETFTDISGDLPDITASWVEPRGDQLLIGMDNGAYISSDTNGGLYAVLGGGDFFSVPITSLMLKPNDPNFLLVGTYGRGIYQYTFPEEGAGGEGPPLPRPVDIRRVAGVDRVQTAIETSQELYGDGEADTVVLSRGNDYADALAGAPYARSVEAPVLLTHSNQLADGVLAEIQRLGAARVVLLGGEEAIEPSVAQELEDAGLTVERLAGPNRYATAAEIALELGGQGAYIAEGFDVDPARGWPDALAIAPLAAQQGRPILLVDTNGLPEETAEALESLNVTDATIAGGVVAVSLDTEEAVQNLGIQTRRIAGETRFGTSALASALAEESGLSFARTWLARGGNWPDALTSGPTVAADGGILLLVDDNDLDDSAPTRDVLQGRACEIEILRILGGFEAIAERVQDQLEGLFGGCLTAQPGGPQP